MRRACVGRFGCAYALRAESRSGWFSMSVWSRASVLCSCAARANESVQIYISHRSTRHKHTQACTQASLLREWFCVCVVAVPIMLRMRAHSISEPLMSLLVFLAHFWGNPVFFSDGEYWNCGRDAVKFVVPLRQKARNTALGGRSECGRGLVDILAATKFAVGMHHRLSECLSSCLISETLSGAMLCLGNCVGDTLSRISCYTPSSM